MYERFTDRAIKVMTLAREEARRLNHEYIGTEHILLGLLKDGNGVAANMLKNAGIDLDKMRSEVEKLVQTGPNMVTAAKLPQTPRAKKAIEYAMEEARNLSHNHVGTPHLLLGLLREKEGVGAQVLEHFGLRLESARKKIADIENGSEAAAPAQNPCLQSTERFTDRARDVLRLANLEAQRLCHDSILPTHILLGLLKVERGLASDMLRNLGARPEQVYMEAEKELKPGRDQLLDAKLPLTPAAKTVLALADEESRKQHRKYMGTPHILFGLLHEGASVASQVLKHFGLDEYNVRVETYKVIIFSECD